MSIFSVQSKAIFYSIFPPSVFLGPQFCWLQDGLAEFQVHFLFCPTNFKSLYHMIQFISLTGTSTFLPLIKKQNQNQNQTKTTLAIKTNLVAGTHF